MKQKTKKQMVTAAILLFFLAAGFWYFFKTGGLEPEKEADVKLDRVLAGEAGQVTGTPEVGQTPVLTKEPENTGKVVVYVCGAVNTPGIYTLATDSRLYEAIAMAGGFSKEADPSYHNLARELTDGERIYILSFAETKELTGLQQIEGENGQAETNREVSGQINLNTATVEQLVALPGIGEAKAAAILEYRKKVGRFTDIEEIMNVSGIGEAMFEKIKDKIIVK